MGTLKSEKNQVLIVEEQKLLVEKLVKSNKHYGGNEDLFEDFCAEAMQKSYMIFNSSSDINKIENYAAKVVNTSIISVLKNSGRVRRTNEGYVPTGEIKAGDFTSSAAVKPQPLEPSFIMDFPDPKETAEEILITRDCLQRIADAVCIIHKEVPSRLFLDIFCLRYIKNQKQAEIAKSLNLSQSEVSKRLMQLSKLISSYLDNGRR